MPDVRMQCTAKPDRLALTSSVTAQMLQPALAEVAGEQVSAASHGA